MSASWLKPRLPLLATGAVLAVIWLGVAMCQSDSTASNSNTGRPTVTAFPPTTAPSSAPPPAPKPPAAGKCVAAWGTKDGSGTLQATTVDLRPANDGKCGGRHPHGQGG